MVVTVASPPVLGWLVDPSLEQEEAGVECSPLWTARANKWQWRANDLMEEREDMADRSSMDDERDFGSNNSNKNNKKSIFRKIKSKMTLNRVSSTDAVSPNEEPTCKSASIMPSMIHLQRSSSRDSVECVLADVFLLPSSSSSDDDDFSNASSPTRPTTRDDDDSSNASSMSPTTTEAVVIDEHALELDFCHVPCNIQVPTKQAVECFLADGDAPSLPSTTSSIQTAQDSASDDGQRLLDLDDEADNAWTAAQRGDLYALQQWNDEGFDWTQQDESQCLAIYHACYSGAVTNIETVRFLLQVYPASKLPQDVYERCREVAINSNVVKLLDAAQKEDGGVDLSLVELDEQVTTAADSWDEYSCSGLALLCAN